MKTMRVFTILAMLVILTGVVFAKTIKVVVSYGNRGSQGIYACFLYRNGGSWDWKYLTNTGAVSGIAQFDGLPSGTYRARIICVTDRAEQWTNSVTFAWWQSYAELRAYF